MLDACQLFLEAQKERAFAEAFNDPSDSLNQAWIKFTQEIEKSCIDYLAISDRKAAN